MGVVQGEGTGDITHPFHSAWKYVQRIHMCIQTYVHHFVLETGQYAAALATPYTLEYTLAHVHMYRLVTIHLPYNKNRNG